jgi:NADPH-dependent ferric siderophore reductase
MRHILTLAPGEAYEPQTRAEQLAARLVDQMALDANESDLPAIREVLDRTEGSAPKTLKLEVESDDGEMAKLLQSIGWTPPV